MSSAVFGVGKNHPFFYRSQKVHAAVSDIFQDPGKVSPCLQKFRSHKPQKKSQRYILEKPKSIKLLIFVDFIYKIVLRLSMFFIIFIFLVDNWREGLEGIHFFEDPKNMGVGLHAILDHDLTNLDSTKLFTEGI